VARRQLPLKEHVEMLDGSSGPTTTRGAVLLGEGHSARLAAAAGLPEIDLHDVRHSYATAGRDAKIDWKALSQRIGHADVAFTMKQYMQTDLEVDRQVANTLAQLIIGGSLASVEVTGEVDEEAAAQDDADAARRRSRAQIRAQVACKRPLP
jgi:hypothetical protein